MIKDEGATAEVQDEVIPEAIDQPVEKSMDDTIRETLQSLKTRGMEAEGEKVAETSEEKAQRVRDESGRFKAAEVPAVPEAVDPLAVPEVPTDQVLSPAPNTWKKEVAAKWATLPPDVQAEVARREADFHKGIEGYRAKAQFADSVANVLQPYQQTLKHLEETQGISAEKALDALLSADHKLRYGSPVEKQMYMHQLAQSYGVDLAPQIPQADQQVFTLQQRLQQLETALQNQTQQGAQREQQELNSTIAAFAADPKHSHFESVKGHMSALLQAGQAKDLADAYEQAVYANPTTRAAMLQQQIAAQREEAAQKAKAAREAASTNVPRRPSMPVTQPIGTMDETIRATLRRLQNAA